MQLAKEYWRRASVLAEMAKEAPEFKAQLLAFAELWLTLAALEDQINTNVDRFHKLN